MTTLHKMTPIATLILAACLALASCAPTEESNSQNPTPEASQEEANHEYEKTEPIGLEEIKDSQILSLEQTRDKFDKGAYFIDLRTSKKYAQDAHVPHSANIPAGRQFTIRIEEVPSDQDVVLMGPDDGETSNLNAADCYKALIDNGYDASRIFIARDGSKGWIDAGYPTELSDFLGC